MTAVAKTQDKACTGLECSVKSGRSRRVITNFVAGIIEELFSHHFSSLFNFSPYRQVTVPLQSVKFILKSFRSEIEENFRFCNKKFFGFEKKQNLPHFCVAAARFHSKTYFRFDKVFFP